MMACCWKYPIYSLFLCRPPPVNTPEMEHQQMRGMYKDHLEFRGSPLTGSDSFYMDYNVRVLKGKQNTIPRLQRPKPGLFAANSTTI